MVHLKQCDEADVLTEFGDGSVDWPRIARSIVHGLKFDGPLLFEIKSCETVWENLETGRKRVLDLGFIAGNS